MHTGRYLSVDSAGELVGKAEAVGQRETWEPVFEEVHTHTHKHTHTHTHTHTHMHPSAHTQVKDTFPTDTAWPTDFAHIKV